MSSAYPDTKKVKKCYICRSLFLCNQKRNSYCKFLFRCICPNCVNKSLNRNCEIIIIKRGSR